MSVFVNGRWEWYRPEWSVEYRAYVDRLRAEGARLQNNLPCSKCGTQHNDPHLNRCSSTSDRKNPMHVPDWGTP